MNAFRFYKSQNIQDIHYKLLQLHHHQQQLKITATVFIF